MNNSRRQQRRELGEEMILIVIALIIPLAGILSMIGS